MKPNVRRFRARPTRWQQARSQRKGLRVLLTVLGALTAPFVLFCLAKAIEAFSMAANGVGEIVDAGGDPGLAWSMAGPWLAALLLGLIINAPTVAIIVWIVQGLREPRLRVDPPSPHGAMPADAARSPLHRAVARATTDGVETARSVLVVLAWVFALNALVGIVGAIFADTDAGSMALIASIFAGVGLFWAIVYAWGIAYGPSVPREELTIPTAPASPPRHVFGALDAASIAMGAKQCRLRMVESAGVNAFVDDTGGAQSPRIFVTRGMADALNERCLTAVFAHLLGKIEHGVTRELTMATDDGVVLGPSDLIEVHRTADAQSLVALKDPEQILDALLAVSTHDNRMDAVQDISPACFYTWPDRRPPFDLDDRMRSLATIGGMAGRIWWEKHQESRRLAAMELGPNEAPA